MDIFRIVTPKIVCEVPQKEPRIPDGTFINLDEPFREGRPCLSWRYVSKSHLEFEVMAGLRRVTRLYKRNGQNFIVRFNRRRQGMPVIVRYRVWGSSKTIPLGRSRWLPYYDYERPSCFSWFAPASARIIPTV